MSSRGEDRIGPGDGPDGQPSGAAPMQAPAQAPVQAPAQAPVQAPVRAMVRFVDDTDRLCRLLFWNTLASFLTLGLYRFWARTRVRRHYFHRIIVAGAPGEYLGRGVELFGGFVIVFALVGLVFGLFFFGGLFAFAQSVRTDVISAGPYLLLILLLPVALFRARRYRLSRTLWRGIRLSQSGSTLRYGLLWLGWLAVTVLSAGLLYPWRNVAAQAYRANHTSLGDQAFRLSARGRDLIVTWLPAWLAGLLFAVSSGALAAWWTVHNQVSGNSVDVNRPPVGGLWADIYAVSPGIWGGLALVTGFLFLAAYLDYRARETVYFVGRLHLGPIGFKLTLPSRRVLRIAFPFVIGSLGYTVLSLAFVAFIAQVVRTLPGLSVGTLMGGPVLIGIILIVLGILFLASYGMSVLFNLAWRSPLIAAIAEGLSVEGSEAIAEIRQSSTQGPRLGEGLVDAFDFGNF